MSTTPEPADQRDERPETEGPLTEADHQVGRASTAPAPVARLVPSNGLPRASTWTTLGTMGGPIASSHRAQPDAVIDVSQLQPAVQARLEIPKSFAICDSGDSP